MEGKNLDGFDCLLSNHPLHHCINLEKEPIKIENTQTLTNVLEWMFSKPINLD